jgi:hypothetical protein
MVADCPILATANFTVVTGPRFREAVIKIISIAENSDRG